ncbi:uncharacterized protein LOC127715106 isoform X2 [Mytilus californianus]|uniref:uncharacterized protein LOC127715106 isoform X2 n=1 Tax=Mytilus californianus TaxID=6549 RepID=UPI002245D524|nr:uncharacterized protein LOC127715106 isoform X2 [Mytilus californianus]
MSMQRKKYFPKLSRLRKDLWAWHSDVESLMQDLDAPKKNALVKEERPEDKMNSKCFEMIHKLCKFSELSTSEIIELLKDIDIPRPISRFASSGQLTTRRVSRSPAKSPSRVGARSVSQEDQCIKQLTFDEEDEVYRKTSKGKKKGSPVTDRNTKKVIKDLEEQIIELEKENNHLTEDVGRLEKEVQWYKDNRDYWFKYCKDNERSGKQITRPNNKKGEYDQLRKQYEHLQGVYENICHAMNKGTGSQYLDQIESDAARYRAERNDARLHVKEMSDKLNWYKSEPQNASSEYGYTGKRTKPRYGKKYY